MKIWVMDGGVHFSRLTVPNGSTTLRVKFPPLKDNRDDISKNSPLSEQVEYLLGVCGYIGDRGALRLVGK